MKTCTRCGDTKPFSEFHILRKSKDGHRPACKSCTKIYQDNWRLENPDKKTSLQASWRAKNYEKELAWRRANPEVARIHRHNRRAQLKSRGKLTPGISEKLFALQKGKCACCKKPLGKNYHMDHIVPLALGGTNTDDNIQLLHQKCNHKKSSKDPIDFMQQLGYLL